MIFNKEHLCRTDYEWKENRTYDAEKEPNPTRNKFDRFNGNCVLNMINIFNRLVTHLSVTQVQNIELMIARELPLTLSSEVSVFNWLKEKFVYTNINGKLN